MRFGLVIVICIVVILGMVVEAKVIRGVHAEYRRRRWVSGQSSSIKIPRELPPGLRVYAEYVRLWTRQARSAAVKIHRELPTRKHRSQHLRQQ